MYDISVLSNIPLSVCDVIDPAAPVQRLRPLFTIGVHDISYLLEHQATLKQRSAQDNDASDPADSDDASSGWIACTTDSILALKEGLWDMLITMPPPHSSNAKEKVWPTIECPKGVPVKATQRDLRRFRSLRTGLARLAAASICSELVQPNLQSPRSETSDADTPSTPAIRLSDNKPNASSSRPGTAAGVRPAMAIADDEADKIVEPTTWAALAYNGFMWWASAGEKRHSDEIDEQGHDSALLADLGPPMSPAMGPVAQRRPSLNAPSSSMVDSLTSLTAHQPGTSGDEQGVDDDDRARIELAIIAYFHRLTTSILGVLADIVDSSDDDDLLDLDIDYTEPAVLSEGEGDDRERLLGSDEGGGGSWVRVDSDALAQMGLDIWSQSDADFVKEVVSRYFSGKRAVVLTKGVEVCGVRVC